MRLAARILDAPLTRHLATPRLVLRGLQSGTIHDASDLGLKDPRPGQGPKRPMKHRLQLPQVHPHDFLRQGLGANRPWLPCSLPLAGAALAHSVADLLGIEAHQLHQCFIAEQHRWQGIHTLNAKQRLEPIEQDVLHIGAPLTLDSGAVDLRQQGHHSDAPQEMEEIIQHGAFIQPVDPIHNRLAVQAPGDAHIVSAGYFPTQPFGQVLGQLRVGLPHRPPPSPGCPPAIEESARQIKSSAYVGTSGQKARSFEAAHGYWSLVKMVASRDTLARLSRRERQTLSQGELRCPYLHIVSTIARSSTGRRLLGPITHEWLSGWPRTS